MTRASLPEFARSASAQGLRLVEHQGQDYDDEEGVCIECTMIPIHALWNRREG